jgi:hypothetical protein
MTKNKLLGLTLCALAFLTTLSCENKEFSSGSLDLSKVTCESAQDCLKAIVAEYTSEELAENNHKVTDFGCIKPVPGASQGNCFQRSRLGSCPTDGCACQSCVKRIDLLCEDCGVAVGCLPSTYCNGLAAEDCDPPTVAADICNPVVHDAYTVDGQ